MTNGGKFKELKIDFGGITSDNVQQLRMVNGACFPVSYNDSFYKDIVKARNEDLSKFAYWNGFVVGTVCSRTEPIPENPERNRLYIMTLGVLAAYRGRGIGSKLIQSVLDHVEQHKDKDKDQPLSLVDEIVLHVQISNDGAIKFYTERFDFEQGPMVENYYRRIDPPHCYILKKKLR